MSSTRPTSDRSSVVIGCEIIAALMKAPRTRNDLQAIVGCGELTITRWVHQMRASGIVHVSSKQRQGATGPLSQLITLQRSPFETGDAE